ncbi:MAG: Transport-associated protein [Proteobacteria bacterium]|nr:Transport-associated protein [Pseudomonadota bacterium]
MTLSKNTLITLSIFAALGLAACDKPGTAQQAGKKLDQVASDTEKKIGQTVDKAENKISEQGTKTAQAWDDTEITAKVKTEIFREPGVSSMQISVDTKNGVVTLTGTVDTKANSDKAKMSAMAVNGVKDVINQLVITPPK